MELGLNGATVVVLGAGPGIGHAVMQAFAAEGASVFAAARKPNAWPLQDSRADIWKVDARDADAVREFLEAVEKRCGGVDVAVCNVGQVRADEVWAMSAEQWEEACRNNVLPLWNLCRYCVPAMQRRGGGAIVNVGSVSAVQPGGISTVDHGFFKAGALNLVKRLAREFAPQAIRINTVSPGFVGPPSREYGEQVRARMRAASVDEALAQYARQRIPMGRLATAADVAAAVAFLASKAASYVTGQNLIIDGGYVQGV